MTTQNNLTEEQNFLLSLWEELTPADRKQLRRLMNHLCKISLELRSRAEFMESKGFVDLAKAA